MQSESRRMRICLVVEGCYPYTVGGVSSWVQMLIKQTPWADFVIQTLIPDRSYSGKIAFELPDNVVELREMFLMDSDWLGEKRKKKQKSQVRLNEKEFEALRSLVFGENVLWDDVFALFRDAELSINDLLMGEDFLAIARDFYTLRYTNIVFSDFLWSLRSIYLPLCFVLKTPVPECDLYHSVATGYAGVWAAGAKQLYGKPVLISEHGIYTREREEELIKANWVKGVYKDIWINQFYKMSRCAYDRADIVTSLFEGARKLQIELGCPKEKTRVTPNGINIATFESIPQKEPDDTHINVGAILRIAPIKDVKTMLNAFYYAHQREPRLKLWIMGKIDEEDAYTNECLAFVRDLGITDVEFTGMIRVPEYVGKMDMLLLTSLSEGQPMIILEGFSAHKPCIATNVGNCEGLIYGEADDFGAAGRVVPVMDVGAIADAITELAQNDALRTEMGEIGYRRVCSRYSQEKLRCVYDDLYNELLAPAAPADTKAAPDGPTDASEPHRVHVHV